MNWTRMYRGPSEERTFSAAIVSLVACLILRDAHAQRLSACALNTFFYSTHLFHQAHFTGVVKFAFGQLMLAKLRKDASTVPIKRLGSPFPSRWAGVS